ncbi:MAG: MoaD/ThiS family protein [Promethearchaeota archaeon]
MITVKVKFLSLLSDLIEKDDICLELPNNSKIDQILPLLQQIIGINFKKRVLLNPRRLNNYVILVINGEDIRVLDGLHTLLRNNDEISFLPALAGG